MFQPGVPGTLSGREGIRFHLEHQESPHGRDKRFSDSKWHLLLCFFEILLPLPSGEGEGPAFAHTPGPQMASS